MEINYSYISKQVTDSNLAGIAFSFTCITCHCKCVKFDTEQPSVGHSFTTAITDR